MTTPAFRDAYKSRRCLVPADAFYEWKANGKSKQPDAIAMRDRHPLRSLNCGRTVEGAKDPGMDTDFHHPDHTAK